MRQLDLATNKEVATLEATAGLRQLREADVPAGQSQETKQQRPKKAELTKGEARSYGVWHNVRTERGESSLTNPKDFWLPPTTPN